MGALAPAAPWIPEDDVLLRNAVEAGGSLESLAKGAVRFSRRYSLQELSWRWYSLLYDPVISAEASVHMFQFERSSSNPQSKLSKLGNLKENKCFSMKRKKQSIRSCYYALRNRIHNEPFNSEDFNYLAGPGNGSCLQTKEDTLTGDYMLGDLNSSHFNVQESDLEMMQDVFPNMSMDGVINTTNTPKKDVEYLSEGFPVGQDNLSKEMPGPLGREAGSMVLFETNGLDSKCLPAFAPINPNSENVCQELEQNNAFISPFLDCGASFHGLDCSSPLPEMPIWKAVEDISLLGDISQKSLSLEEAFAIEDMETNNADPSALSTEGYLEELSNALLNFTNEEEHLFMDVDAKDVFDKSYYDGLNSLLLNSPVDVNQEGETPDLSKAVMAAVASKTDVVPDDICKSGEHTVSNVSGSITLFSETCNEFMFCALNMEDPEIPCNDDVVFPNTFVPSPTFTKMKSRLEESSDSISSFSLGKKLLANARSLERGLSISHGHHHGLSQLTGSQVSAKNSFNQTVGSAPGTKCEVYNSSIGVNLPDRINPSTVRLDNHPSLTLKKEPVEISRVKHLIGNSINSALERPLNGSDIFQCQQLDEPREALDRLDSELGSMNTACLDLGIGLGSSAPEQIESDDDLPSFRDVEAMILDMDLDPDCQDLYSNEKVLQYNDEAVRRKIVRLEQGAHSYMQRAIASHGAFAILYGRYSKCYIRKQEVLIGRGNEDFKVDIDLRKEGRFIKVSRQQATIKLEKNGSFLLKNLGDKFPIFVNNKAVAPGLSTTLTPHCLIEIRGTPFIFNINPICVKRFLEHSTGKHQEQA